MIKHIVAMGALSLMAACINASSIPSSSNEPKIVDEVDSPAVAASSAPILDDANDFKFAIMGDRTGSHRPGVWERSIQSVNQLRPAFVMSVGDYIEGYIEDRAALDAEWTEFEQDIASLAMRFFYVAGNHDISNQAMTDLWETRRGPRYYHFIYKDVLFLAMNTEDPFVVLPEDIQARSKAFKQAFSADPDGTQARVLEAVRGRPEMPKLPGSVAISDDQVDYFKAALKAHADVRWTLVFMHKPAWRYDSEAFARIEEVLADRPYSVIAGHEHYYEHETRFGRDYVTMATCGGVWLRDGPGRVDHTLLVSVTDSGPVFANIKIDGVSDLTGFE